MAWKLIVKEGPDQGLEAKVEAGMSLGRAKSSIVLKDTKISGKHAYFESRENQLEIVDNKSTNGIKLRGNRIDRCALVDGLELQLGRDLVTFVQFEEQTKTLPGPPPEPMIELEEKGWDQVLEDFTDEISSKMKDRPKKLKALNPALQLNFSRGIQVDTKWILGYGPRKIGKQSIDLPIFDPEAPEDCFEIEPNRKGVLFRTKFPEQVRLNGEPIAKKLLEAGDSISFADTQIDIELID